MKKILKYSLFVLFVIISCSMDEKITESISQYHLVLDSEIKLDFSEPSGLTYCPISQTLWVVNDSPANRIYNINLEGLTLQTFVIDGNDFEGISYDIITNTLWIVDEKTSEIINISLQGKEIKRIELPISQESSNSGLEGICLDSSGNIYLLKEKNPGKFYKINSDFTISTEIELTFASDYSGIWYDSSRDGFWIISDASEKLYLWDITNGIREQYSLNIPKVEGIVFVSDTNVFYLVSDSEAKLYKLHLEEYETNN